MSAGTVLSRLLTPATRSLCLAIALLGAGCAGEPEPTQLNPQPELPSATDTGDLAGQPNGDGTQAPGTVTPGATGMMPPNPVTAGTPPGAVPVGAPDPATATPPTDTPSVDPESPVADTDAGVSPTQPDDGGL